MPGTYRSSKHVHFFFLTASVNGLRKKKDQFFLKLKKSSVYYKIVAYNDSFSIVCIHALALKTIGDVA